jgi:hypothetical protein
MLALSQNLKAADQWQSTRQGQEVVVDNTHDAPPEKEVPTKKKPTDTEDVLHPLDDDAYSDEDVPEDEFEEEISEDEADDDSMLESLEDDSLDEDIPEEDDLEEADEAEDE